MTKNELIMILKVARNTELWPMIALIAPFVLFAWMDEKLN